MKGSDVFPSKWLSADDLQDREITVVIAGVEQEVMSDGKPKPVMTFQGAKKGMVVNKTNWKRIAFLLKSEESDDWIGREICLHTEMVDFKGEPTNAIRVIAPKRRPAQPNGGQREHVVEERPGYKLSTTKAKSDPIEEALPDDGIPF